MAVERGLSAGDCPDDDTLIELAEALLAPADHAAVERHLDRCARCLEVVAGFAQAERPERPEHTDETLDQPARLPRGGKLGRYVILDVIGAGAMGTVYAARDPELDRDVAIKCIHPRHAATAQTRDRVMREARALARLAHPNAVTIHDVGVATAHGAAETVFVVMERIDGATLTAWRAGSADRRAELAKIFLDIARGLAAAHAAGIVHRDVKPDNMLVGRDGRARIGDFGLARAGDPQAAAASSSAPRDTALTVEGAIVGTPAYMAPEQLRGEPCDARADQFAFCTCVYEAWQGRRPFPGDTPAALASAIARQQLDRPTDMPDALWRAIRRGLSASSAHRHASMAPLIAALEAPPVTAEPGARGRVISAKAGIAAALIAVGATCVPWVSVGFVPRVGLATRHGLWVACIALATLLLVVLRYRARPHRVVGATYLCGGLSGAILTGLDLRAIQRVVPDNLTALIAPEPGLVIAFAALVALAIAGAALIAPARA